MFCIKCGNQIDDTAVFCSHCGAKVGEPVVSEAPKASVATKPEQPVINVINNNTNTNTVVNSNGYVHKKKWTAFWLCLLLGEFGIHRFYVGKIGTGIIWLLTLGFFGIGWFIDLLLILFGGFKDKAGQRLV